MKTKKKKSTSRELAQLLYADNSLDLEDLRWRRDLAARDNDTTLALACAIAIDKRKALY